MKIRKRDSSNAINTEPNILLVVRKRIKYGNKLPEKN